MPGRFFPAVIEAGKAAEMLIVPAAGRAVERGKPGAAYGPFRRRCRRCRCPAGPKPALAHEVMPRACHECGRALIRSKSQPHTFRATKILLGSHAPRSIGLKCAGLFRSKTKGALPPAVAAVHADEETRRTRLAGSATARLAWERAHRVTAPERDDTRTAAERAQLDAWYKAVLQPRLCGLRTIDVARALDISRVYVRGERMPHPRHFEALANLAGVPLPQSR